MASKYPSNRPSRTSSVQPGISRESGERSRRRGTSAGGRYGGRSDGERYGVSQRRRETSPGRRRSPSRGKRRKGASLGIYALVAVFAVALLAVVLIMTKPGDQPVAPANTAVVMVTATPEPVQTAQNPASVPSDTVEAPQYSSIAEMLGETNNQIVGLAADQMVHVDDLAIRQGLSEEWMNVLLLGTDERTLTDSARTDAMLICSINRNTGEVKLASIMRDLAVDFYEIGDFNGIYRINAANYFGGPDLAMKKVNELFEMNIQYYVMVNFFGFARIAQQLGGVEVNVSETEMNLINKEQRKQFKFAYLAGITDFDLEQKDLTTYGENIHLNGNQTLAYARIRKLEGGDYMRTTRQQIVLEKLLEKVKKLQPLEMGQLLLSNLDMIQTNMEPNDILAIAGTVVSNGLPEIETMRLPVANTYKEEVRDNQGMLYDCDFATNALRLYNFIYE